MTTALKVSDLLGEVKAYAYNPAAIQRQAIAATKAIYDGQIEFVDATNPFVRALENSSVNTAAFMQHSAALTRRQYPAAATTAQELYLHMADPDYANIFALPTEVEFQLVFNKRQLLNALVLDAQTGISKVTIPRNSVFYAADVPFSLQYPIDIRKLEYGALQIVYDVSKPSPLQNIASNLIAYDVITLGDGQEYVRFSVNLQQFDIVSSVSAFDQTSGSTLGVVFSDQFYAARVYVTNSLGNWSEIAVTYTDQVYDVNVPTAVLQVVGDRLNVRLPQVYINSGLVSGKMRVDVYQTRGPVSLELGNYTPDNFSSELKMIDEADINPYTQAAISISDRTVFSTGKTTGGRDALSFEQLQLRVIQNSNGPRKLPITPSQIQTVLLDAGYTLVKYIDTLTARIYWATKALPKPQSDELITSANAAVSTITVKTAQADQLQGCYAHSTGMTIGSAAIVQNNNGVMSLMTKAAYASLMGLNPAQRVNALNASNYTYSPFYYVLDTSTDSFAVRPYYLDEPTINFRTFVQENPDTGLQVSIGQILRLDKTQTGYQLTIQTASNDAYKQLDDSEVFCQLMFRADNGTVAYLLGQQLTRQQSSDERVFVFDLQTAYDIDSLDQLAMPSFSVFGAAEIARCGLNQLFNVLFVTTNTQALQTPITDMDSLIGTFQFAQPCIAITHERLSAQLGYVLDTLWNSWRSYASEIAYQKHLADVPAVYEKDVYEKDPVTGSIVSIVNGQVQYNVLHRAGDPILNSQGQPVYKHRAGDLVLDNDGLPIPIEGYQTQLTRVVDLITIDGVYAFANDTISTQYENQIKADLLSSLTKDLVQLNAQALEQTRIYYYPLTTQGVVSALADNNQLVNLEAAQSLKVVLYVDEQVFNNSALTTSIQTTTVKTLSDYLSANVTISASAAEKLLSDKYGSDVKEVTLSGLGGSANYRVVTLTSDSNRLSIKKSLKLLPSGQFAVQEGISVVFALHGRTQ